MEIYHISLKQLHLLLYKMDIYGVVSCFFCFPNFSIYKHTLSYSICFMRFYLNIISLILVSPYYWHFSKYHQRQYQWPMYFQDVEYKHRIARKPLKVENKILMDCFDKLLGFYDKLRDQLNPPNLSLLKNCKDMCLH